MDEWEQFRTLLRDRFKDRGAQARLAKASGIKSPVIGHWARGETRPSPANLKRIAPELGRTYEDLLRMCGYLPGEVGAPDDAELEGSKFIGALRDVPRQFWSVVVDASVALANAYADVPGAPAGPVSDQARPPVRTTRSRANNRPPTSDGPLAGRQHRPLALLGAT